LPDDGSLLSNKTYPSHFFNFECIFLIAYTTTIKHSWEIIYIISKEKEAYDWRNIERKASNLKNLFINSNIQRYTNTTHYL